MPPGVEPLILALRQYDHDAALLRLRLEKRREAFFSEQRQDDLNRVVRLRKELAGLLWRIRRTERALAACWAARP